MVTKPTKQNRLSARSNQRADGSVSRAERRKPRPMPLPPRSSSAECAELLGFKLSLTRITDLNYVGGPTTFTPDV